MPTSTKFQNPHPALIFKEKSSSSRQNGVEGNIYTSLNTLDDDVNRIEAIAGVAADASVGSTNYTSNKVIADGTAFVAALSTLDLATPREIRVVTGADTIIASDRNKLLRLTGTPPYTMAITAAATLGGTFEFAYFNDTGGTVTLDPNSTETIDGASTSALAAGSAGIVNCNGIKFWHTARNGTVSLTAGNGVLQSPTNNFIADRSISAKTSTFNLTTADRGILNHITSGTFTITADAAATLGNGWFSQLRNSGTGVLTLDPNSTETIDGLTTIKIYPGESFTIHSNGANLYTTGRQKGPILLSTQSASSVATIDFTQGMSDTEFKEFWFKYYDVMPATDNVTLFGRVSLDGGSSYRSTAGDYNWTQGYDNSSGSYGNTANTSDTEMELNRAVGNASNEGCSGIVIAFNLPGTTTHKRFVLDGIHVDNAGTYERSHGYGVFKGTTGAVTGFRFMFSSGNIASGFFELWGVRL